MRRASRRSVAGTAEFRFMYILVGYFVLLALLFYFVHLGQLAWDILALSAIGWLVIEGSRNRRRLTRALEIGLFLMLFDLVAENAGWFAGLWHTVPSNLMGIVLALGVVPVQVMCIALFGGAAWALYLPRKFNKWHSLADCIVFAFFGALGERLLIGQGLFVYTLWWNSYLAFAAYLVTWAILHAVRYRVLTD